MGCNDVMGGPRRRKWKDPILCSSTWKTTALPLLSRSYPLMLSSVVTDSLSTIDNDDLSGQSNQPCNHQPCRSPGGKENVLRSFSTAALVGCHRCPKYDSIDYIGLCDGLPILRSGMNFRASSPTKSYSPQRHALDSPFEMNTSPLVPKPKCTYRARHYYLGKMKDSFSRLQLVDNPNSTSTICGNRLRGILNLNFNGVVKVQMNL